VLEGATVVFVDEVGTSLKGVVGTTWAPAGETPKVSQCCQWQKLSTIGGISYQGEVFEQSYSHSIRKEQVVAFLDHLAESIAGKLLVIWDGAPIHRAKFIQDYLDSEQGRRITLLALPPYAPECNPIEWLWAWIKRSFFANLCATSLEELEAAWQRALQAIRARPDLIRSFFAASALKEVLELL
jgi:transposase